MMPQNIKRETGETVTPKQILSLRAEAEQLYEAKAFEEAAVMYGSLIENNPYDSELKIRLMNCAIKLGQTEQAIELAKDALRVGCKFPERICYEVSKLYLIYQ